MMKLTNIFSKYYRCHELGHAWGLPHTDETFGNKGRIRWYCLLFFESKDDRSSHNSSVTNSAFVDLGNCMDYTRKFSHLILFTLTRHGD